ncbi:MAG: T9SS type A sorting domain-containing protein [Bacteroidota bacterium]
MKINLFIILLYSLFIVRGVDGQNVKSKSAVQDPALIPGTKNLTENANSTEENMSRPDSVFNFKFNTPGDSVLIRKTFYDYDGSGKILKEDSYLHDPDFALWFVSTSREYSYDANGNTISEIYSSKNRFNDPGYGEKTETSYNAAGNEIQINEFLWVPETVTWNKVQTTDFEYQADGKRSSTTKHIKDNTTQVWYIYSRTEYKFDAAGNNTVLTNLSEDQSTHELIATSRYYHYYNTLNQIDSTIYQSRDGALATLVNVQRSDFGYATDNQKNLDIEYLWDSDTNKWLPYFKTDNVYDDHGNLVLNTVYTWDQSSRTWVAPNKYEVQYDQEQRIIKTLSSYFDDAVKEWIPTYKTETGFGTDNTNTTIYSTYDRSISNWIKQQRDIRETNGTEDLRMTQYIWDQENQTWQQVYKYEYAYDVNDNQILNSFYQWDPNSGIWIGGSYTERLFDLESNILLSADKTWNSTDNTWDYNNKTWYYYSTSTLGALPQPALPEFAIRVFPNPCTDILYVSGNGSSEGAFSEAEIYDLSGKKVAAIEAGTNTINISDLKAGIYLIKLRYNEQVSTQKIVKK